ncbi:MAG: tRNA (adenosine(37)-N6)-dimethylallyltransferase MiaA [Alphaproteobacteria bacterium]
MLNNLRQTLYFITGPTCIGKSSLAIRFAKKINGVIINADSMQVYSNLNILTARPSKKDLLEAKHELYGYVDAAVRYNVSNWCNDVLKIIKNNEENNLPSIIVGGSGMYIDSLLNGLIPIPPIPEKYKNDSLYLLNEIGIKKFTEVINNFDSESLSKISLQDSSRMRRVWEVYQSTGKKYSYWINKKNKIFLKNFSNKIFLFIPPRDDIYKKINLRFNTMINEGAIEEVKKLISLNLDVSLPIMKAHGVPEITNYLCGKIDLEECIKKSQQVTRNYAKRQLTWWRSSRLSINKVFDQFPNEIDEKLIKI